MDLGFEMAGWELKWAVECDKRACETHRHNRKDEDYLLIHGDVREVKPDQLSLVDCIIGGPPCQGFSTANTNRAHANGNLAAWKDDPRNLLYKEYLRLVTALRPKYFVMENVKPMYTTGAKDNGQPGPIMEEVLRDFTEVGYRVAAEVLDAVWFGVPQFRERTFVIGVRHDVEQEIRFPVQTHGEAESGYPPYKTLREAVTSLVVGAHDHNPENESISETRMRGFERRYGRDGSAGGIGIRTLSLDAPSPTIQAHVGKDAKSFVYPSEPKRFLTLRECARIQTVPDWYEFFGSKLERGKQIGNGVPVAMARRIAATIIGDEQGRTVAPYQLQLTLDDLLATG